jgi:hypothetical protein
MTSGSDKQDWLRLYAAFALIGLIAKNKKNTNEELQKEAFSIAEGMVKQEKFNG